MGRDGSTVRGFVINRFGQSGIWIESDGNTIAGNWIGLDATGALAAGNGVDGVVLVSLATDNTIGGDRRTDRNVISANLDEGVSHRRRGRHSCRSATTSARTPRARWR